ncbi:family S53 protease [Auricularia subglabra TFB-10046 SS5]|nr:family S53 protease [Auricularia subglabra TFB-10046 SS5]
MVLFVAFVAALALAHNAVAAGTNRKMRVHEQRARPPPGFTAVHAADGHTPLTLRLSLKQQDTPGLIDALYRVSDPSSAEYGKHLSKEEVEAFMAPAPGTAAAVNAWLADHDVRSERASPAGDWIQFTVPVSKANMLFDADFKVFQHTKTKSQGIRTLQYSLPSALGSKVNVLFPGISFWNPSMAPKFTRIHGQDGLNRRQVSASCLNTITPPCLQQLYGIPSAPATKPSNNLAVSGFIEQFANQADLTQFLTEQRPDNANATFETRFIDGGSNPQDRDDAGVEAASLHIQNLDIQYTVGVATNVPTTFISVGELNQDDFAGFLDIVNFLLNETAPAQVLSTSYGFDENVFSQSLGEVLCNAYASLGVRGTSILFASGDGGVSGIQSESCTTFQPTFPAGCPFITSVGATTGVPETSASFSSGGFSNLFSRPDYQSHSVTGYLSQIGNLHSGLFNASGRAFPDVAAMGDNVLIAWQGIEGLVAGTSASTPIFASIVALINDRLAAKGKPPLGFLNPFLYANPHAFTDIHTGNNPGCKTNGFPALGGWDPVTGLGTPIFSALAAAAGV